MKILVLIIMFLMHDTIFGQANFEGSYYGTLNGDATQVILKQIGNNITGLYKETQHEYRIQGTVVSNTLTGQIIFPDNNVILGTFESHLIPNGIHLDINLLELTKVSVDFYKTPSNQSNSSRSSNQDLALPHDDYPRDPLVVGTWIKEEIINSGVGELGAGMTIAYYLTFNRNGTFVQEKAGSAGGGNWSSVTGRTLDVTGHWYTKDNVMYVRPSGQNDYSRLNQYLFHDGALVFKTIQGKYLIWNKN